MNDTCPCKHVLDCITEGINGFFERTNDGGHFVQDRMGHTYLEKGYLPKTCPRVWYDALRQWWFFR